ncbi:MAG: hypothetical protein C4520_08650 [Candidatus Abyssobacteria bacterium SURF_5]|uniref:DUF883 family protein n=1 Tax=Abyssobacteria bacterium (strain SURF_5) TaxID=2093360 RepID=A0A3A4NNT6_ABYX5|nr:MAG: hypothetical protein C4520_08650 [Candidatus Abyssubacteria bacterium SURF_5]
MKGKQRAQQWKAQAQEKMKAQAATQRSKAAHGLEETAEALRQAGQSLREKNKASLADYAEKAAERTDDLSHYLREKDIDELIGEVEGFVRRQPWVVVGGAFLAGAMLSRFLKASGEQAE